MSNPTPSDVFGIASKLRSASYVDRGELDSQFQAQLARDKHIALRGESKCGKSWFRQKNLPDCLVVQCRLGKTLEDIYEDALSQLEISLTLERSNSTSLKGTAKASGEAGFKLLAKVSGEGSIEAGKEWSSTDKPFGRDINDLRFISDLIRESGRRLVIEDFHYLSTAERKRFSFDLKALWDLECYMVIIGVWSQSNMLLYLNPDLAGRVYEIAIYWSQDDLKKILDQGGEALNIEFNPNVKAELVALCYANAGLLQQLTLDTLDLAGITNPFVSRFQFIDVARVRDAAMFYAEQLNPLYQQFAKRVAKGIRSRKDSTSIYAHTMAVIMYADDEHLINGLGVDVIFQRAHTRESRIQKGNLKTVLQKFEGLQVDEDGRGLVLAYNEATEEVTTVDRQILLYRKFATVAWPWEELVNEEHANEEMN